MRQQVLDERVARLRVDFPSMLHDVLDREELPEIARNKKHQGNVRKKDELSRKTIGGTGMAVAMKVELRDKIRRNVLAVVGNEFGLRFEKILRYSASMLNKVRGCGRRRCGRRWRRRGGGESGRVKGGGDGSLALRESLSFLVPRRRHQGDRAAQRLLHLAEGGDRRRRHDQGAARVRRRAELL